MVIRRALIRFLYVLATLLIVAVLTGLTLLLESKFYVLNFNKSQTTEVKPFPVGVNLASQIIIEQPEVNEYFSGTLANNVPDENNWRDVLAGTFAGKAWFQNLASPVQRIVVIWPGERHEQVVDHFGDILGWNNNERALFANLIQSSDPILIDGKFMPGKYVMHKDTLPEEAADLVYSEFTTNILQRYTEDVQDKVPIENALIIAALLEREASDFENMREISGIIWNRLFIDMPLQLDATLQYARGSRPYEPAWWPVPRSKDKFIDSPFNTYKHSGLPPAPIANPSVEAVLAALNPRQTDCIFYFHTDNGTFYCSEDYEAHVSKLRSIYGTGR